MRQRELPPDGQRAEGDRRGQCGQVLALEVELAKIEPGIDRLGVKSVTLLASTEINLEQSNMFKALQVHIHLKSEVLPQQELVAARQQRGRAPFPQCGGRGQREGGRRRVIPFIPLLPRLHQERPLTLLLRG